MEENGDLIRLYPMPFRLISDEKQFKKWQWITARIDKARKDHRRESHTIFVDTIHCDSEAVSSHRNWQARRALIQKIPVFVDFAELEAARKERGVTLGLVQPSRVLGLDIERAEKPDWTDKEKGKLLQLQHQANLFDETDLKSITALKKLPFDFHYRYAFDIAGQPQEHRHKVVDWEVGALYWNVYRSRHPNWQVPFRSKLEHDLPARDLMFLMGTIHRFPDQWLIASLIYPPKPLPPPSQGSLFDLSSESGVVL